MLDYVKMRKLFRFHWNIKSVSGIYLINKKNLHLLG